MQLIAVKKKPLVLLLREGERAKQEVIVDSLFIFEKYFNNTLISLSILIFILFLFSEKIAP